MKITKPERKFISEKIEISSWEDIQPYFEDLNTRKFNKKSDLEKWLEDRSELEAVLEENLAWRYIKMSIDTSQEELAKSYTFFVSEIQPKLAPYDDILNKKMMDSPFINEFKGQDYFIYFRSVSKSLELYTEENITLEAELATLSQDFGAISAAQTINYKGEKLTMQKASTFLKNQDRSVRKEVYELIVNRRAEDIESLDELFSKLVEKRHQLALNAGFENYRDYKFEAMGRFDYSKEDCFAFHEAIKTLIVPLVKNISKIHKEKLDLESYKPFDTEVDPEGNEPLNPFLDGEDLLKKTITTLNKIDPYFGDCLATMDEMNHLDLDSKKGKSPGGYNYPLYEVGVPFIFMNAVGSQRDLVTMVHEGGHAIHSFLSRDLALTGFKNLPSEVAELASMSMELLTMDYWDTFYTNEAELKRAKREQLEAILKILPWIATIDEFQHWIYEHPHHTVKERHQKWISILDDYGTGLVDYSGFEQAKATSWQKQLHLFEVPFYYIEYAMAQLGALGIWKNSKIDFEKTISQYKSALRLGYTKTIPDIYKEAGIRFDFSKQYVFDLAEFVKLELEQL